jgi:hypothetical protein
LILQTLKREKKEKEKMKKAFAIIVVIILCFSMFSILPPQAKAADTTMFEDNFESYTVGTFPSSGGWELVWNGMGTEYQVITDAYYVSPTKSLQLWGNPNDWSAVVQKHFSSTSRFLGYQVSMMVSAVGGGGPGRSDYVGFFCKEAYVWGKHYAAILFNHDTMNILTDDNNVVGTWTPGVWYNVKVLLDRNTNTYSVWIDGQLKGTNFHTPNTDTNLIDAMQLQSDHPGVKDYFDDVRVFEAESAGTTTLTLTAFDESGFSPASATGFQKLAEIKVKIYDASSNLIASGQSGNDGTVTFNLDAGVYTVQYGGCLYRYITSPQSSDLAYYGACLPDSAQVTVAEGSNQLNLYVAGLCFHAYQSGSDGGDPFQLDYLDLDTTTTDHETSLTVQPGQTVQAAASFWELETINVPVWLVSAFGDWNPTVTLANLAEGVASPSSHSLHTIPFSFTAPTQPGTYHIRINGALDYDWCNSYYTGGHFNPNLGRDMGNSIISNINIDTQTRDITGVYGVATITVVGQSAIAKRILIVNNAGTFGPSWYLPDGTPFTLMSFLRDKGFLVDVWTDISNGRALSLDILPSWFFDVQDNLQYQNALLDYVNQGGGLLFAGQSGFAQTLDGSLGFKYVDGGFVDASIVDFSHPIMQGISELPKAGGVFVDWDNVIAETPLPPDVAILARTTGPGNRIALIAFQHGNGRVVAGPSDGLLRPYGPTGVDSWSPTSQPVIENELLINAINWVARQVPANQPPSTPSTPQWAIAETILHVEWQGTFQSSATDPDNDQVKIVFVWGDDTTDTSDLKPAGTTVPKDHWWFSTGMFEVRAKAIDEHGAESGWSLPLEVTVVKDEIDKNWGGYMVTLFPTVTLSVEGIFTYPDYTTNPVNYHQSTFIGIGGNGETSYLLQAGIALNGWPWPGVPFYEAVINKQVIYSDFGNEHLLDPPSPGDLIETKITEVGYNQWEIYVKDITKGWTPWTRTVNNFQPDTATAEWIHEPGADGSGIADFGSVTFQQARLTVNSETYEVGNIDQNQVQSELFLCNMERNTAIVTSVSTMSNYETFTITDTGERPAPTSQTTTSISIHSSARLSLWDSEGNHDGYNTTSGLVDMQIPDSYYFEDQYGAEYVTLLQTGVYRIDVVGIGDGDFHLHFQVFSDQSAVLDEWINGTTAIGAKETHHLYVPTIGTPVVDDTPPTTKLIIGEPKYAASTRTYVTKDSLFTLTADDWTGSGVAETAYRISNSTYDSGWTHYATPFNLTSLRDGNYTIAYNSTDNVGNVETTHQISVTLFSWNYVFEDTYGRGTILKINTAYKFFQFIAPGKDYGIRQATCMQQCGRAIIINHCDKQLRLITAAVDTKLDFCVAVAWDLQTRKQYFLMDKPGIER